MTIVTKLVETSEHRNTYLCGIGQNKAGNMVPASLTVEALCKRLRINVTICMKLVEPSEQHRKTYSCGIVQNKKYGKC